MQQSIWLTLFVIIIIVLSSCFYIIFEGEVKAKQTLDYRPRFKIFEEKLTQIESDGEPSLSLKYDPYCKVCKEENGIHFITNFFVLSHPEWSKRLKMDDPNDPKNKEKIDQRMDEIETTLQRNLNHPHVAAMHILYLHPYIFWYLSNMKLSNKSKMVFHLVDKDPTHKHPLEYASEYLIGKIVLYTNQDIYLDAGWHNLNKSVMREQKIMYALTRGGKQEKYCKMQDNCRDIAYVGCHDTFVFVLTEKVPEETMKHLDFRCDQNGVENIFIWVFKDLMKYKVLNPCRILETYHYHCSRLRRPDKLRLNNAQNTGLAPFTDKLQ